jgi:hypothetical protein
VVTMEDLAGPHAVPNRILRVGRGANPLPGGCSDDCDKKNQWRPLPTRF